jgi:carbon monoxide dehydrogenase subunit G
MRRICGASSTLEGNHVTQHSIRVSTSIDRNPVEVIRFIADVRNRAQYQSALKSVSDCQGNPQEVGSSWRWKWSLAEREFEGQGRCTAYDEGRRYTFVTDGDISSEFDYQAEGDNHSTRLTVNVRLEPPAEIAAKYNADTLIAMAKQRGEEAIARLKDTLENPPGAAKGVQ